jgi:leucyl/phenylalanyl-tRNA---protein transferase
VRTPERPDRGPDAGPVEPPPTPWALPGPESMDPDDDLVALGADLEPGTLLAAYRRGLFPMPIGLPGQSGESLGWFCPVERGVLPLDGLRVSRSLRRSARDLEIRVDSAFDDVIAACADPRRPSGWITGEVRAAYTRLHRLGWAHSVETWRDGELVGGLYGVAIGGLFAGESMFHRTTDASKVALLALVDLLRDEHAGTRLLDVQWRTDHLARLGVVEVARGDYLARLATALATPLPARWQGGGDPRRTR